MNFKKLLTELKRRNVFKVATAYAIAGWLIIQICTSTFPYLHLPDWLITAVIVFVLIGFPISVIVAWAFEMTPEGVKRTDEVPVEKSVTQKTGRKLNIVLGVVLVLAVGIIFYQQFFKTQPTVSVATTKGTAIADSASVPSKSIAVLPFENLSEDKKNGYFADGMQDMILTKLADIGQLKVISRTSTAKYSSHPDNLRTIAKQLGVATILEGSVQKAGDQVLINLQLINARTDSHIWAQAYTRTLKNIFGVEGEVAQKVADALNAKLTAKQTDAVTNISTKDPDAYDAYLRGEHFMMLVMAGQWNLLPRAVEEYKKAVKSDPVFALAWAKMAVAQSLLMYASVDRSDSTAQKALANAQHALLLAPDLSYAHFALGYVYRFDFAEYGKALSEFELARKGLPNNSDVLSAIAYIKWDYGELQSAADDLQRAVFLNPNDPVIVLGLGVLSDYMHRYDRARIAFNRARAIAPDDPEVYSYLAQYEILESGDVDSAFAILNEAPAGIQSTSEIMYERAYLYLYKREYKKAESIAGTLQPGSRSITRSSILLLRAEIFRLTGDEKKAKDYYRKADDEGIRHANGRVTENTIEILPGLAVAQAGLGRKEMAFKTLNKFRKLSKEKGLLDYLSQAWFVRARVDVLVGDNAGAITGLDHILSSQHGGRISVNLLRLDPFWDPLRKDPAFQALLKKYPTKQEKDR
ncbi:MAG TPA: tetratricopeptide repeat protein [Balneolales bacterium]|nr:tetratricopeptide repeat protein [Balneolales bacterium]